MTNQRKGDWIQTYTGKQFFPLDPREDEVDIEDIAHALSMQCRYGGHAQRFYSVAEHCVHLHDYAMTTGLEDFAFAALMHDAAEAYIVDVPRPIKRHLTEYKAIELELERVIFTKFALGFPNPPEVMLLDTQILTDERLVLMRTPPIAWDGEKEPLGIHIECWSPTVAKVAFLDRFHLHTSGQFQLFNRIIV